MLSNPRFFIRTLLIVLSFTATWIVLTASAAIEGRDHKKLNSEADRADGLAAWEQVYSVLTSPPSGHLKLPSCSTSEITENLKRWIPVVIKETC